MSSSKQRRNPSQQPKRHRASAQPQRTATVGDWVEGARLRTLPLAVVPVVLGFATATTVTPGEYHWVRALAALVVALCLQIGVNFANDYSDGVRGTDDVRVGPARLTGSGLAKPSTVRNVAFAFFALAALAGLFLVVRSGQWWLLAVGVACILAAWFYTGGKRPYGYAGLGEVFVFVFFGLVATAGTAYVMLGFVPADTWVVAVASGLFACAVLMVNNIRDVEQDKLAGKRTLASMIGYRASRILFAIFALLPFAATFLFLLLYPLAGFAFFALLLVVPAVIITATSTRPRDLILALKLTSIGSLVWALLLSAALVVPIIVALNAPLPEIPAP